MVFCKDLSNFWRWDEPYTSVGVLAESSVRFWKIMTQQLFISIYDYTAIANYIAISECKILCHPKLLRVLHLVALKYNSHDVIVKIDHVVHLQLYLSSARLSSTRFLRPNFSSRPSEIMLLNLSQFLVKLIITYDPNTLKMVEVWINDLKLVYLTNKDGFQIPNEHKFVTLWMTVTSLKCDLTWPSLLRGPFVIRGFQEGNFSSQKPRTREEPLYYIIFRTISRCSPYL
jgi:hypothetical protein